MLAYLALGSNIEPRIEYLDRAVTALESIGRITALSSIYETEPLGPGAQSWHLNQVVALQTGLTAADLLASCQQIERALGRQNRVHWGPREIDIDILLYENEIIDTVSLHIPHQALTQRRFVLVPLNEIASTVVEPRSQITIQHLLEQCTDILHVQLWTPNTLNKPSNN